MGWSRRKSLLQYQVDLIAAPVFVADEGQDHRFRFSAVNTSFARLYGLPKEQAVGREPVEVCADPSLAGTIAEKYLQCLGTEDPVSFNDRLGKGENAVLVEITLQRIALTRGRRHRIVGTALEVRDHHAASSDVEFYVTLARNSLTTIEMLMKAGQRHTSLSISEREATEILTRKALLALQDAERVVARLAQPGKPQETGMAQAVRSLLLH